MQLQKKFLELFFKKSPEKTKQEEEINNDANLDPFAEENLNKIKTEEEEK